MDDFDILRRYDTCEVPANLLLQRTGREPPCLGLAGEAAPPLSATLKL